MSRLDRNYLMKAFGGSALVKMVSLGLGFLLTLILARALSPDGYGIYSLAIAVITIAAIPAQMGIPEVVVRETSKFIVNENWPALKRLWRWAIFAVLASSGLAVAALLACYILWFYPASPHDNSLLWLGLLLIPFMALASLRGAMLSGIRRVVIGQFPEFIVRPFILSVLVGISFIWNESTSPQDAMVYHVIAAVIAFIVGTATLLKFSPAEIKSVEIYEGNTFSWIKSAIPLALISGMYVVNQQLDILFLGWLGAAEDVGIYKVISQMGLFVIFGQQMVRGVISTEISRHWAKNDLFGLEKVVQLSGKISFGAALLFTIIFICFGNPLLGLLFGLEYVGGYKAMVILCLGQLINASFGPVGNILNMTGYANSSLVALGFAIVINCFLNVLLIPLWGLEGAACATTVSIIVWNLMLWKVVRKSVQVRPTIFKV